MQPITNKFSGLLKEPNLHNYQKIHAAESKQGSSDHQGYSIFSRESL